MCPESLYTAAASSSALPLMHPPYLYPMSRREAELQWEFERQRLQAHIATLPSFSFEKTKFEEDEHFYATFPEARQAAINSWISEQFPFAPWAELEVAQYDSSIDPTYNMQIESYTPSPMTPTAPFTTYTLGGALTAPSTLPHKASQISAVPKSSTPPMPVVHYDYSGSMSHDVHSSPASVLTADTTFFNDEEHFCVDQEASPAIDRPQAPVPTPHEDDILRTLELLAPARRSGKHVQKVQVHLSPRKRISKNPYPSTSPTSSRSIVDSPPSSPASSHSPTTPKVVPSNAPAVQLHFTGDWEEDAITTAEYINSVVNAGKTPSVSIPVPTLPLLPIEPHIDANLISIRRRHRYSHRQRLHPYSPSPPRAHSHSHSHSHSRSPSRERSKSASPPDKRPNMLRDKNGKPIMACHFCRGRKIACGPPPKGSNDPTCNQCARRGLDCQYPTVNRRGMRKKKSVVDAHDVASEASSSPSSNITPRLAALELVKISKDVAMSDYSDESGSDWDGDN